MISKQKCVTHARATFPRLMEKTRGCLLLCGKVKWQVLNREESALYNDYILSLNAVGCSGSRSFNQGEIEEKFVIIGHTPTLGDWLELIAHGVKYQGWKEPDIHFSGATALRIGAGTPNSIIFSLTKGEPATEKDWDTLAELLNL